MEQKTKAGAHVIELHPRCEAGGEAQGVRPAPGKRRNWTVQRKMALVMELLSKSTPATDICRREGITPSMLYQWRERFLAGGQRALLGKGLSAEEEQMRKDNELLRQAVADLTVERDLLVKKTPWTTPQRPRKSGR